MKTASDPFAEALEAAHDYLMDPKLLSLSVSPINDEADRALLVTFKEAVDNISTAYHNDLSQDELEEVCDTAIGSICKVIGDNHGEFNVDSTTSVGVLYSMKDAIPLPDVDLS